MAKENLGKVMMIPKGEYSNDITYEFLDIVSYNGSSYVCKKDTKGNTPENLEYWQVIVEKPDTLILETDFSTEEKVIGTWIDGKPLYRKIIETTTNSAANSTKTMDLSALNVKEITHICGTRHWATGSIHIPYYFSSNDYVSLTFDSNLLATKSPLINEKLVIRLEYTKKTD